LITGKERCKSLLFYWYVVSVYFYCYSSSVRDNIFKLSHLSRKLGLLQATAINMTDMVGIGPFVTLPVVIACIGGPGFLWAWVAGAVLSFFDAMIWSELGAAYPKAGGSYNFLKEAYGPEKWGKLMSFLLVWQTCIQAPLVIASAAIGFAQYVNYLHPLEMWQSKAVSGAMVVLVIVLLYRRIEEIGKISVLLWVGVLITMGWIIGGGFWNGNMLAPIKAMNDGFEWNKSFAVVLGYGAVKTVYSYLGYYNVCHLGGEMKNPGRNIPLSMFISIAGIAILYMGMNISVTSVIPWQDAIGNKFVVSTYIEKISGHTAALVATCLILWVAFASVFSATLGYSRIPYAAAIDGSFFPAFGKLHPTKNFPYISLLALGSIAFVFSLLFKIEQVISAILAMRIMVQFIGQGIGVVLLRKRNGTKGLPFKMPLYPIPVIIAIGIWIYIYVSTGVWYMLGGLIVTALGVLAFYLLGISTNQQKRL
jgi:fructoselysine transporter